MFACMECGRKFPTFRTAEQASRDGCPVCGGSDIDIDVDAPPIRKAVKHGRDSLAYQDAAHRLSFYPSLDKRK